jgi:putative DNA primase/helicase
MNLSQDTYTKAVQTFENIPTEVREIANWVLWKKETVNGRLTKIPYQTNGWKAKSNTPATWATFDEVVEAFKQGHGDGIGWCVPLEGDIYWWGFDVDDAIDPDTGGFRVWRFPNGDLAPIQPTDALVLKSYTEKTPSGAGFRVFVKCERPVPAGKKKEFGERNPESGKTPGIEMYSTGRFFTFTGEQLPDTPNTVEERTNEALEFHSRVIGKRPAAKNKRITKPRERIEIESDDDIEQLAIDLATGRIGPRHDLLFSLGGTLANLGWKQPAIGSLLKTLVTIFSIDDSAYDAEATLSKHLATLDSNSQRKGNNEVIPGWPALKKCLAQPTFDKVRASLTRHYPPDDTGNGMRLVDKNRHAIRYCTDEKCWYVWDGVRWNKDEIEIQELAKGVASDIRAEAHALKPPAKTGDKEKDKEAARQHDNVVQSRLTWANQSGNGARLSHTAKCASSDPRIRCMRSDFDSQPHLLNCANGVVDLKLGTIVPHGRNLMLSYLCPVDFHPHARHRVFDESLLAFTRNHSDLQPFLKTLTGYTIQGTKSEERIIILHGLGNAGKGTLMDWLTNTLGSDYACAMDYNSVRKQNRNSASPSGDIARLEGKRLVIVSEVEKGSRVSESFMKQASGNDSVVARNMYKGEREFRPTHQFWFQTNYRPGFDSMDSGNRRRYIEIPFDNDLSKDPLVKFNGKIKTTMRENKDFLQAVLAWAVAGAVDWFANGLHLPASVEAATAALFASNDFLSAFMEDECIKESGATVPVKRLWDVYELWCKNQGEEPALGRTYNRMMEERTFVRKPVRVGGLMTKVWTGIRLKTYHETREEANLNGVVEDLPERKQVGGVRTSDVFYDDEEEKMA